MDVVIVNMAWCLYGWIHEVKLGWIMLNDRLLVYVGFILAKDSIHPFYPPMLYAASAWISCGWIQWS